nr:hypothetical protein [Rubricoccus marinus]
MLAVSEFERTRGRGVAVADVARSGVPRELGRSEPGPIPEHGEQVPPLGGDELRVVPRRRAEVASEARPCGRVLEHVEQVPFGYPRAERLLERVGPLGHELGRHPLEVGLPGRIDGQLGVVGEGSVVPLGRDCELVTEPDNELGGRRGQFERFAVRRQPDLALIPGQELLAVVSEGLGAGDEEVARTEGVGNVAEHGHFEFASPEHDLPRTAAVLAGLDERSPAQAQEAQVDFVGEMVPACRPVLPDVVECSDERTVLRGGLRLKQVQEVEER